MNINPAFAVICVNFRLWKVEWRQIGSPAPNQNGKQASNARPANSEHQDSARYFPGVVSAHSQIELCLICRSTRAIVNKFVWFLSRQIAFTSCFDNDCIFATMQWPTTRDTLFSVGWAGVIRAWGRPRAENQELCFFRRQGELGPLFVCSDIQRKAAVFDQ